MIEIDIWKIISAIALIIIPIILRAAISRYFKRLDEKDMQMSQHVKKIEDQLKLLNDMFHEIGYELKLQAAQKEEAEKKISQLGSHIEKLFNRQEKDSILVARICEKLNISSKN